MDLEYSEIDIIYKPSSVPLHLIQYPLRDANSSFENFLNLDTILMKPIQKKLEFNYKPNNEFENVSRKGKSIDDINIQYTSKHILNRTNYCVGVFDQNSQKIFFFPIQSFYQMRRKFDLEENKFLEEKTEFENEKKVRKEKNLEQKLRTYTYQKEVMEGEKALNTEFYQKNSNQSLDFMNELIK